MSGSTKYSIQEKPEDREIEGLPLRSFRDFIAGENLEEAARNLDGELKIIFDIRYEATSQLSSSYYEQRTNEVTTSPSTEVVQQISQFYFHSEQALGLYLRHYQHEYLPDILRTIPEEAFIHYIVINIASDREVCRRCAGTYFRMLELPKFLAKPLQEKISKYNGAKISKNGLNILVEVSANTSFDRPRKEIMQTQKKQDDQPIEAENIQNQIIQNEAEE